MGNHRIFTGRAGRAPLKALIVDGRPANTFSNLAGHLFTEDNISETLLRSR